MYIRVGYYCLLLLLLLLSIRKCSAVNGVVNTTAIKKIYTLENPTWLSKAGFSKGISHDRQHLGIILAAGDELKIRQTNQNIRTNLQLKLLNDDRRTESTFSVGKEWLTVKNEFPAVPFIDTPYITEEPTVQYSYPESSKTLPVYRKNSSESNFFALWDSQDAEFAVVDSDYVTLLVPKCDKERLRELELVPNIDGLIHYYDNIFTLYNDLAGLSFEPHSESDKNIPNRYFMKADRGYDKAWIYYDNSWTAQYSKSIAAVWLTPHPGNWGSLHEIAHGYEGKFMRDSGFDVDQVWNNIYAATYQNIYLGEKVWRDGWLYGGEAQELFDTIRGYITTQKAVNTWGWRKKLYFLMLMKERAGDAAFAHFNQRYRKLCNSAHINCGDNLLDGLSYSYAKVGNVDVTPFIQRVQGHLSRRQIEMNVLTRAKAVYPLCELVHADELPRVQSLLKLDSPLSLVDPRQLQLTELQGNLELNFDIDHFREIYGETLRLMEGERYLLDNKITAPQLHIANLPIGVYTLMLPLGKKSKYSVEQNYAIVKQGDNQMVINYRAKNVTNLISQKFFFLGLGHELFATLYVDGPNKVILFDVTSENPHSHYTNRRYAQVTARSHQGGLLFDKEMQGSNVTLSSDQIPFDFGDQIEIFHAEPTRLRTNIYSENIFTQEQINQYILTELGLNNTLSSNDPAQYMQQRLKVAADEVRKHSRWLHLKHFPLKNDIYLAIQQFPEDERQQLQKQYQDMLTGDMQRVEGHIGHAFNIAFEGLGDWIFFTTELDFISKTVTFETRAICPHSYFDRTYAYIRYLDSHGVERYRRDFIGDQENKAEKITFTLSAEGQERLLIHHKEPSRLVLHNEMQNCTVPVQRNNIFEFVYDGIQLVAASDRQEDDDMSIGHAFYIAFEGFGDWIFFTIKLDFISKTVTFETRAGRPHSYYNSTYAYIRYLDPQGVERYRRDFIGDQENKAEKITFTLSPEGQERLLIHHEEPSRLVLHNEMQTSNLPVKRNNIFELVKDGIQLVAASDKKEDDGMVLAPMTTL